MYQKMLSNVFAHLPNGIIRYIVAYTGATYKKRNGKYMGQIPKNDPRYEILRTRPNIKLHCYDEYANQKCHTIYIDMKANDSSGLFVLFRISLLSETHNHDKPSEREWIMYRLIVYNDTTGLQRSYEHISK